MACDVKMHVGVCNYALRNKRVLTVTETAVLCRVLKCVTGPVY